MRLDQVCADFLEFCLVSRKLSDHTIRAYTLDLKEFRLLIKRNKSIKNVSKEDIKGFHTFLSVTKKLKSRSIKRKLACLKSMFSWLEEEEVIEDTPFRKYKVQIKTPFNLPRIISHSDVRNLLSHPLRLLGINNGHNPIPIIKKISFDSNSFKALTALIAIETFYQTAIRVNELCSIDENDIDIHAKIIVIKGKGSRQRSVFILDDRLLKLIQFYIELTEVRYPGSSGFLKNSRGGRATSQFIRHLIVSTAKNCGIKKRVTPHMIRHTSATHLLESGVDIRFVQKLLGHQSIATTQIYTHVSDRNLRETLERLHPRKTLYQNC